MLQAPPCGDDERPVAAAFEDVSFRREIERRWSMLDYLADSPSMDRIAGDAVSYRTLKAFALNSIAYSFLPDADRQRLLRRLENDFASFEAPRRGGGH